MSQAKGLVVNLERCMGCYACEVACQQEHQLPEGEKWIRVHTFGPFKVNGELAMDFAPMATDGCDFCEGRASEGKQPFCVEICPTRALGLYGEEQILRLLREGPRVQICKMGT